MSSLDALYQQVILDHARERHGHGLRNADAGDERLGTAESHRLNPLCGDEVTLRLVVADGGDGDLVVRDLSWVGEGCSISQAATSVLHDLVVGRRTADARSVLDDYRAMVRSRGRVEPDESVLGDAAAFAGVGRYANRVECAMLGWTAFEDALSRVDGSDPPVGRTSEGGTT